MSTAVRKVTVYKCVCQRCGHKWTTRTGSIPKRCPGSNCKSIYWQTKRRSKKAGAS